MSKKKGVSLSKPNFRQVKLDDPNFNRLFNDAMYYVHYEVSTKTLKEEVIKFCKNRRIKTSDFSTLENYWFTTIGKPCYLYNYGAEIPDKWMEFIYSEVDRLREVSKEKKETDIEEVTVVIDRTEEKVNEFIDSVDSIIDTYLNGDTATKLSNIEISSLIKSYSIPLNKISSINEHYRRELSYIKDENDQDESSYGGISLSKFRELSSFLSRLSTYSSNEVKELTKSQKIKMASSLKYANRCPKTKLKGHKPVDVLESKEMWVYNIRTKKLAKYVSDTGFGIHSGEVINVNMSQSHEKSIRKNESSLSNGMSTEEIQEFYDKVSGLEVKPPVKLSDSHLILKLNK